MPGVRPGRGGKRPGAGAPAGNMNNLKHGLYSKQFAQVGALLAQDPKIRQALIDLARKHNLKQHRANEVAALLFTRLFERAETIAGGRLNLDVPIDDQDSIKQAGADAAVRQIRKLLRERGEEIKNKQRQSNGRYGRPASIKAHLPSPAPRERGRG